MHHDEPILLTSDDVSVDVRPAQGGRVAQILAGGTPLLIGPEATDDPMRWGSYPMVPWAGRIRRGRFAFDGVEHQLPLNDPPHAIHGVGFTHPWDVVASERSGVRLALQLPSDDRWPFGGRVEQTIRAAPDGVRFDLRLTAAAQPFPFSMGWHPWFRKPSELEFHPTAMFRRDDEHVTVDELVEVPPGPWDDCFVNTRPVRLHLDELVLTLTSPCERWVVYSEPEHATCVEPQTAPPDAFNLGPPVLRPGQATSATWRLRVSRIATT